MSGTASREARRDREWKRRRREILAAAAELFAAQSFEATTMQEIADASGFSVGYLYRQFAGKQELINGLFADQFDAVDRLLETIDGEAELGPLDRYRLQLVRLCEFLEDRRALINVLAAREHCMSGALLRRRDAYRERTVVLLREAVKAGQLPPTEVRYLAALLEGVLWSLCREISEFRPGASLRVVPDLVEQLVLMPLREQRSCPTGKETDPS
jgi:AcrR family transcriptional regulator